MNTFHTDMLAYVQNFSVKNYKKMIVFSFLLINFGELQASPLCTPSFFSRFRWLTPSEALQTYANYVQNSLIRHSAFMSTDSLGYLKSKPAYQIQDQIRYTFDFFPTCFKMKQNTHQSSKAYEEFAMALKELPNAVLSSGYFDCYTQILYEKSKIFQKELESRSDYSGSLLEFGLSQIFKEISILNFIPQTSTSFYFLREASLPDVEKPRFPINGIRFGFPKDFTVETKIGRSMPRGFGGGEKLNTQEDVMQKLNVFPYPVVILGGNGYDESTKETATVLGGTLGMQTLVKGLIDQGIPQELIFGLDYRQDHIHPFDTIAPAAYYSNITRQFIDYVLSYTQAEKVIVMGYSLGAMVAFSYVAGLPQITPQQCKDVFVSYPANYTYQSLPSLKRDHKIAAYISIGSSFKGLRPISGFPDTFKGEFAENSPFTRFVSQQVPKLECPIFTITSSLDAVDMFNVGTGHLSGQNIENYTYYGSGGIVGHLQIVNSQAVVLKIMDFLQRNTL